MKKSLVSIRVEYLIYTEPGEKRQSILSEWVITVKRSGSWTTFVEAMVQVYLLRDMELTQEARLPRSIQRLHIDPRQTSRTQGRAADILNSRTNKYGANAD